ncbi:hypothetical protein KSP39_PZI016148 [Platanthera zijinensis]|uniref:Uncharacterized protein n=1 Tax=Platanthera zijinensis TaxID=2320716 RepID=A0AAP0B6Q2_9ASPA
MTPHLLSTSLPWSPDVVHSSHLLTSLLFQSENVRQGTSLITWLLRDYNMIQHDHSVSTETYSTDTQPNHSELEHKRQMVQDEPFVFSHE